MDGTSCVYSDFTIEIPFLSDLTQCLVLPLAAVQICIPQMLQIFGLFDVCCNSSTTQQ